MRVSAKLILLLSASGLLLACTSQKSATPEAEATGELPEPPIEVRQVSAYEDLSFPLDAYSITHGPPGGVLEDALITAAQHCFTQVGAPAADLASLLEPQPKPDGLKLDLLMLTDEEEAARSGLHDPSGIGEQELAELPSEVEFALYGEEFGTAPAPSEDWTAEVPSYGCYGNALRVLDGDDRLLERLHLGSDLVGESWERAREHSKVTATFEAWASCMRERGYDYQAPDELYADPRFASQDGSGADLVTDEERAAAVDLVRCSEQSQIVGTLAGAVAAYQELLLQHHADDLARFQDHLEELQLRAASAEVLDDEAGRLS